MKRLVMFWFILLLSASYAAQGSVTISYALDKNIYHPGEYGTLYLTIQNPTSYPINNLDIRVYPGKYIEISSTKLSLDNLPAGASQQSSVIFTVNSSAKAIISQIRISAEYYDYEQKKREYDVVVPVKILDPPELKVSMENEYSITLGRPEKICFKIVNFGGEARDVEVKFNSSIFSLTPNEVFFKKIENVEKFCTKTVTVPESTAGVYPLRVYLSYTDALYEDVYEDSSILWLNVSGLQKLIVYPESRSVENFINLVFSNAGNEKLKSLFVKLSSDIDISPREIYIGDLDVDDYDSERISLTSVPGKHWLNITAIYRDVFEREHEKNFTIEFMIPEKKEEKNYTWVYALTLAVILFVLWKVIKK